MTADPKTQLLRLVLAIAALGHLVVGLSFWFVPELAIDEILAWGEPSGWTSILGAYDIAVAYGMWRAFRDPLGNEGFIRFAAVLLTLHAATHAYYIVGGDSPARLWLPTAVLLLGAGLLASLPRLRDRGDVADRGDGLAGRDEIPVDWPDAAAGEIAQDEEITAENARGAARRTGGRRHPRVSGRG